jgi:hypothetical protein
MVIGFFVGFIFLLEAGTRCDIGLTTDNGLDTLIDAKLIEFYRAVNITVIGDRKGGKLEFCGFIDETLQDTSAIKEAVLGMDMEVDKLGMCHFCIDRRQKTND